MKSVLKFLPLLPDPRIEQSLNDAISNLKHGSDDCLRYAQKVEAEFVAWLNVVCELHEVTVAVEDQSGLAEQEAMDNIQGLEIEQSLTAERRAGQSRGGELEGGPRPLARAFREGSKIHPRP